MPTGHAATAGSIVDAYVTAQLAAVTSGEQAMRRDDDSAVHSTRVATRRLRSTLRVFAPYFDSERATALDVELRWYAALLGEVRDRQVMRSRIDKMIDRLEPDLLPERIRDRVDADLLLQQHEHWIRLASALDNPRYAALLADLTSWVERPPHSPDSRRPAIALIDDVKRARRSVRRRLKVARKTDNDEALHLARKSAKRARYAVEATSELVGPKRARREVRTYRHLQDLLGEHQDSVVSAAFLRGLGVSGSAVDQAHGFAFGVLYEQERQSGRAARVRARHAANTVL